MSGRIDICYGIHFDDSNHATVMEILAKSDKYKKIGKKSAGDIIVNNTLHYITSNKLSIEGNAPHKFITINELIKTEDTRYNKGEIDLIADIHQYLMRTDDTLELEYGWKIYYTPNKN